MNDGRKNEGAHAAAGRPTEGLASDTQWPRWEVFK